jgi:predicted dehydrogenase
MVRIGFIGTGFICQQCHLPAFTEVDDAELVALADIDPNVREKMGARFDIPRLYSSHEDLLTDPSVDAVVIVVKRNLSYGLIKEALAAGKHVLTEKPLCLDPRNAQELVGTALAGGLVLNVGYMKRHDSGVLGYRKFIQEKLEEILPHLISIYHYGGDSYWNPINQIRSTIKPEDTISHVESIPKTIPPEQHLAYENFINTYSHSLDLVEHLTRGTLANPISNVDDEGYGVTTFNLGFENQNETVPVSFQTAECRTSTWEDGMEIVFPNFITKLRLPPPLLRNTPAQWSVIGGNSPQSCQTFLAKPSWAFVTQAQNFVEEILNQQAWVDTAAARHVELVHDIFRETDS